MLLVEYLESALRNSIAFLIESILDVCKELTKFIIILLLIYYIAIIAYEFLGEVFGRSDANQISGGTLHRTSNSQSGRVSKSERPLAPIESDLLRALEIEAEFEENIKNRLLTPENDDVQEIRRLPETLLVPTDSDEGAIAKKDFVSLTTGTSKETTRAAQTVRTSLGKKSMPKNTAKVENPEEEGGEKEETENQPLTAEQLAILQNIKREPQSYDDGGEENTENQPVTAEQLAILHNIKREPQPMDERGEEGTENQPLTAEQLAIQRNIKTEPQSFDDQRDHESFHRI